MLHTIINGDRDGAEQAARRAAQAFGLATGGDPVAIEANVGDSDATLWFGRTTTEAAAETVVACRRSGKPCLPLDPCADFEPIQVAAWIAANRVSTLHVAGNREAEEPGIGDRVERFLGLVLERLGLFRA